MDRRPELFNTVYCEEGLEYMGGGKLTAGTALVTQLL